MKEKLIKLLSNAYAPYSKYKVAAIVLMNDGQTFNGVNVENASYGATICAERNAINNAIAAGYHNGDFKAIYVMVDSDKIGYPCFNCRQVISEFFDMNADIVSYTSDGKEDHKKVSDLVVYPFNKENLS